MAGYAGDQFRPAARDLEKRLHGCSRDNLEGIGTDVRHQYFLKLKNMPWIHATLVFAGGSAVLQTDSTSLASRRSDARL